MKNQRVLVRVNEHIACDKGNWPCSDKLFSINNAEEIPMIKDDWVLDENTNSFCKMFDNNDVVEFGIQLPNYVFLSSELQVEIAFPGYIWLIKTKSLKFKAKVDLGNKTVLYDAMSEEEYPLVINVSVGARRWFILTTNARCPFIVKHISNLENYSHDTVEVTALKTTIIPKACVIFGKGVKPKFYAPVNANAGEVVIYDLTPLIV